MFLADRERLGVGEQVRLFGAEARHAATVRRLTPGERVAVTDGAGLVAEGVVTRASRDEVEVEVRARREEATPSPRLTVVQALAKGDRAEHAVEAMTEIGVDVIVPWAAQRCITQWDSERERKGVSRWAAKAREATKQSGRAFRPEIAGLATTSAVADRLARGTLGVVLDGAAEARLHGLQVPGGGDMVIVVGPEGGLTPDELSTFASAGAVAARLGPTVLRTSTAGVAAAAVVLSRSGRW